MRQFLLLVLAFASAAQAAPVERDLGQGLVYYRVHSLPADLPTGEANRGRPCILDVRYVGADLPAAESLLAWLKFHAATHSPVFLLANADTSPLVLAPLNSPDAVSGLVILGSSTPSFSPDIALKVDPAIERKAYDALEKGTPIDSLVAEKVDKTREDEAFLDHEHLPDSALGDHPSDPEKPAGPPQLIDLVLQRAVQLDRAMLALRRLP